MLSLFPLNRHSINVKKTTVSDNIGLFLSDDSDLEWVSVLIYCFQNS